jgi:single-stranded-DNA-specific exonuclease
MRDEALSAVESQAAALASDRLPPGLCLWDEGWHQGVVGILASRLKERFHRPVVAFAPEDAHRLKGSARSVPGVHIRDVLEAVNARHPGVIGKFGGHAMAAGLTLAREAFEPFRAAFEGVLAEILEEAEPANVLLSDGELAPEDLSLPVAECIQAAGPWGQGFPEPVFHGAFQVLQCRIVGERHLKLRVQHAEGGEPLDAIAFNQAGDGGELPRGRQMLAYRLDVNDFRGRRSAQLVVEHLQAL